MIKEFGSITKRITFVFQISSAPRNSKSSSPESQVVQEQEVAPKMDETVFPQVSRRKSFSDKKDDCDRTPQECNCNRKAQEDDSRLSAPDFKPSPLESRSSD
jgi:hypothetical protein